MTLRNPNRAPRTKCDECGRSNLSTRGGGLGWHFARCGRACAGGLKEGQIVSTEDAPEGVHSRLACPGCTKT